ncbi:glutamate receptor 2.8-like [Primulina huaijiensis]|uniref:glutamate receptor 2.8-like n=1 Tax=Primulina huaijiensis TaxID=1492673 RepID=UPI003CC782C3
MKLAHFVITLFLFLGFSSSDVDDISSTKQNQSLVHIGLILDVDSEFGSMVDLCIGMAITDFYSDHPNYKTRLKIHTKDAKTLVDINFAVQELLKYEKVHGVLGPHHGSSQDTFVAELGERIHVPFVSFTARTSALSYGESRYSIRTTPDDSVQAKALAELCRGFEWTQVVVLYEDTEYGHQFLSHLNKALQQVEVGIAYMIAIPTSVKDYHLWNELSKLLTKQTRVFVVHMSPSLGYRLFAVAEKVGMMREGYAWIITDSLSNFMNSMDSATRNSMEGVVGIRPFAKDSKNLQSFRERWKRNMLLKNSTGPTMELNIYGLWAYDTINALAIALEKIRPVNSNSLYESGTKVMIEGANLSISSYGPRLLSELSATKFRGLSGDFQLDDGKLKASSYEIFNVIGNGEKTVGFWNPDRGIVKEFSSTGETSYSTSAKELKQIIWPGDSVARPKGWDIPTIDGNLRVGVPWKSGFTEFVTLSVDPITNYTNASGFSVDIFLASLKMLPFLNYKFYCYNDTKNLNWSYDNMLARIPEEFDMLVGDTTIWAPRTEMVDFSQPYSESGVVLVVKNRKPFDMWIFIKPLRWDLWLAIIAACILMGIVLRILENQPTYNIEDVVRPSEKKRGMAYLSPVTVLAFPERNMATNNWSSFVLVFWVFMAFILMQSYTANLSAILTVDQLKFAFSDNYYVGCQDGSFMIKFLTEQLHISGSRLRKYASVEDYHKAMSKGSKNGGIDAIFDEVPYMKLFLKRYDSEYKMVGPTYRTGGFGFAFPKGSPLAAYFSKAIVDITQGTNMTAIEQKNFGPGYSSQDPLTSMISQQTSSLTVFEFAGLFIIVGSVTLFALFCSATPIGKKLTKKMIHVYHVIKKCIHFRNSKVTANEDIILVGDISPEGEVDNDEALHDDGTSASLGGDRDQQAMEDAGQHGTDTEIQETGRIDNVSESP